MISRDSIPSARSYKVWALSLLLLTPWFAVSVFRSSFGTNVPSRRIVSQNTPSTTAPTSIQFEPPLTEPLSTPRFWNGTWTRAIPALPASPPNHWWLIDYWNAWNYYGSFTAVANSISGLSLDDDVLILPMNLAYGSSSTWQWFQFDIDFNGGANGWPNNIWWGIWNVDSPGTSDSNYHPHTIGLTYTIGHTYHYQGSLVQWLLWWNFRFQIWDDSLGTTWYMDFSIPSTSQFYNYSAFSPASAVEGYTTPSTVGNVPYYQFTIGYGMTSFTFGQYGIGVPNGLATDRQNLGGTPSTWHWEMTSGARVFRVYSLPISYLGQDPESVKSYDIHASIKVSCFYQGQAQSQTSSTTFDVTADIGSTITFQVTSAVSGYFFANKWDHYGYTQYGTSVLSLQVPSGSGVEKVAAFFFKFDFSLGSPAAIAVTQGSTGSNTITVTLTGEASQTVTLSASGLPSGTSASFNPASGNPSFSSTCTIRTSSSTPPGSYTIGVTGSGGEITRSTQFTLTVFPVPRTIRVYSLHISYLGQDPESVKSNDIRASIKVDYIYQGQSRSTTSQTCFDVTADTGTQISFTVTSTPSGYVFANKWDHYGWLGGQHDVVVLQIEVPSGSGIDKVAAFFKKQFMLTVSVSPTGGGTLSVSSGLRDEGTIVPVTATPSADYSFYCWSLDGANMGGNPSYSVLMDSAHTLTAFFRGTSSISLGLSAESVELGASVTISGTITPTQPSPGILAGTTVVLSCSLDGSTWNVFAMTPTGGGGAYSIVWYPPYKKTYQIKASWGGNSDYGGSTSPAFSLTVTGTAPRRITLLVSGPASKARGSSVTFDVLVTNASSSMSTTLYLEVVGPGDYRYFDTMQISVDAAGTGRFQFLWQVPSTLSAGQYQVFVGLIPAKPTAIVQTQITVT